MDGRLSEKYVALLMEKHSLYPIAEQDVYQTLKDLIYAIEKKTPTPTGPSTQSSDKLSRTTWPLEGLDLQRVPDHWESWRQKVF